MKHTSSKQAKRNRNAKQARADFVAEYGFCWACGSANDLCCHEMAKGWSIRCLAFTRRYCWFVACSDCNVGPLNDYSVWPLARQLAVKWQFDWQNFWLVAFNILRGRGGMAIEFSEVVPFIEKNR